MKLIIILALLIFGLSGCFENSEITKLKDECLIIKIQENPVRIVQFLKKPLSKDPALKECVEELNELFNKLEREGV